MLSPSAAKRWMTCTPSARVESKLPSQTTTYAQEGTYAHAVAERLLHFYLGTEQIAVYDNPLEHSLEFCRAEPELLDIQKACVAEGFDFDEMLQIVHDNYVAVVWGEYVKALAADEAAVLFVEARVDISDYVPESFGSSDAIIIASTEMKVFDLKFGRGVKVSAKANPQMRLYALGALIGPGETYPVDKITMTIVQPRLHAVSIDTILAVDLITWASTVLSPLARQAFRGEGDFVPGDHCEFCRAKATCKALAEYTARIVRTSPEVEAMGAEELAQVLTKLPAVESWIAGVKAKATEMIERGQNVPGWKLVEGRSTRKIYKEAEARQVLQQAGFTPADYDDVKLKGITDLTKLVGGAKTFNTLLGDLIEKTPGKATLAPADDPRPAFTPAAGAEAAFAKEL